MMERCKPYLAAVLCWILAISPLQAPATGTNIGATRASSRQVSHGRPILRSGLPAGSFHGDLLSRSLDARTRIALLARAALDAAVQKGAVGVVAGQASALLPDGRVLVLGGKTGNIALSSAFI